MTSLKSIMGDGSSNCCFIEAPGVSAWRDRKRKQHQHVSLPIACFWNIVNLNAIPIGITMYLFALFRNLSKNGCIPLQMSNRSLGTKLHLATVTPMMPHHFYGFRLLPLRNVTLGQFLTRELRKQYSCSGRSDYANEGLVYLLFSFRNSALFCGAHISFDISGTKRYVWVFVTKSHITRNKSDRKIILWTEIFFVIVNTSNLQISSVLVWKIPFKTQTTVKSWRVRLTLSSENFSRNNCMELNLTCDVI